MAYTQPRTWVVGETVTAALLNAQVRDNVSYLYNKPRFKLRQVTTGTAIPTDGASPWTTLSFDTRSYDTDSMASGAGPWTFVTAQTAGLYILTSTLGWGSNSSANERTHWITSPNDTTTSNSYAGRHVSRADAQVSAPYSNFTTLNFLGVGQTSRVKAYQASGASITSATAASTIADATTFSGVWIGV